MEAEPERGGIINAPAPRDRLPDALRIFESRCFRGVQCHGDNAIALTLSAHIAHPLGHGFGYASRLSGEPGSNVPRIFRGCFVSDAFGLRNLDKGFAGGAQLAHPGNHVIGDAGLLAHATTLKGRCRKDGSSGMSGAEPEGAEAFCRFPAPFP
jgi:hypothetical protein